MTALTSSLTDRDSQHPPGMGWASVLLGFSLFALAIGVGAQAYWKGNEEWFRSAVFGAFTLVNSLRILAYIPQMLTAAKDTNGASGVSYATWLLFLVSHLTTITYAVVYLGDAVMALIFLGNALACSAVIAITIVKRRRYAVRLMKEL